MTNTPTCRVAGCTEPRKESPSGARSSLCSAHEVAYRRGDRFGDAGANRSKAIRLSWARRRGDAPPKPEPKPKRALFDDLFDPIDIDPTDVGFSVGNLSRGGLLNHGPNPATVEKERRLIAGESHVIDRVKFGRDRVTTCAFVGCDFECAGATDEAMAFAWAKHVTEERRAKHAREFPVEIVRRRELVPALGRRRFATSTRVAARMVVPVRSFVARAGMASRG